MRTEMKNFRKLLKFATGRETAPGVAYWAARYLPTTVKIDRDEPEIFLTSGRWQLNDLLGWNTTDSGKNYLGFMVGGRNESPVFAALFFGEGGIDLFVPDWSQGNVYAASSGELNGLHSYSAYNFDPYRLLEALEGYDSVSEVAAKRR